MADITGMEAIGRVLPIYQGEYNNSKAYEETDIVLYNNSSYIALQNTAGNPPPESDNSNEYWQLIAKGIIANISDTTVKFEQAKIRENIQSDEDVKTLFGKIKKWFAEDKATKDGNGSNIAETYAEKTLVGAERTGLETNIQYSYPSTVTGEKKVITNVKSLKLAIENSTNNLTRAILHFKDTAGTKTYWNLTEINSTLSWETATITDIYRSMREETIACMEFPTRCPVANEMDFANSGTIMIFKTNSEFRVPTPIGFAAQAYHPEDTYIINTKSTNGEVSIKVEKVFTKSSILNSTAITKQGEYALDAIEKNAAIEGTLANLINSLNSNMMNKGIFIDAWISKNIKIGGADDADYPASVNNQLPFDNYHKTGECFTLLPDGGIQCNRAGTVITFLQIVDTPDTVGMNLIYKLSSKNAPYSHEKRFGFRPVAQMLRNMTALNVYTVQNGTIITCEAINYTSASNVIINGINPYNTRILCILC